MLLRITLLLFVFALASAQRPVPQLFGEFTATLKLSSPDPRIRYVGNGTLKVDVGNRRMYQMVDYHYMDVPSSSEEQLQVGSCFFQRRTYEGHATQCQTLHRDHGSFFDDYLVPANASLVDQVTINGYLCEHWITKFGEPGQLQSTHYYLTSMSGSDLYRPVRVVLADSYQIDYVTFDPHTPPDSAFAVPALWACDDCSDDNPPLPKLVEAGSFNITASIVNVMPVLNGSVIMNSRVDKRVQTSWDEAGVTVEYMIGNCSFSMDEDHCDAFYDGENMDQLPPWSVYRGTQEVNGQNTSVWEIEDQGMTFYLAHHDNMEYPVMVENEIEEGYTLRAHYSNWKFYTPHDSVFVVPSSWDCDATACQEPSPAPKRRAGATIFGASLPKGTF